MSDVPGGLGPRGRAFWTEVLSVWELSRPELTVLEKHCVLLDEIDALSAQIDADGPMIAGSRGQAVVHPAVAARHSAIRLATQLLGQLKLPDEAGQTLPSPLQVQASRAAQARWGQHPPRSPRGGRRGSAA